MISAAASRLLWGKKGGEIIHTSLWESQVSIPFYRKFGTSNEPKASTHTKLIVESSYSPQVFKSIPNRFQEFSGKRVVL